MIDSWKKVWIWTVAIYLVYLIAQTVIDQIPLGDFQRIMAAAIQYSLFLGLGLFAGWGIHRKDRLKMWQTGICVAAALAGLMLFGQWHAIHHIAATGR